MARTTLTFTLVLMAYSSQTLNAGVIGIDEFSGNESIVDFGNPGSSEVHHGPYTVGGVTISSNTSSQIFVSEPSGAFSSLFANLSGASMQGTLRDAVGSSAFEITFNESVNRAGFLLSGFNDLAVFEVSALSGTTVLQSQIFTQPAPRTAVFAGFQFNQDITGLRIIETSSGTSNVTVIDDIRFESFSVPEPSSFSLAIMSLSFVLLKRGRHRKSRR